MTRRSLLQLVSTVVAGCLAGLPWLRAHWPAVLRPEVVARVDDGLWHTIVKAWDTSSGGGYLMVDGRKVDRCVGLEDAEESASYVVGDLRLEGRTMAWRYRKAADPDICDIQTLSVWDGEPAVDDALAPTVGSPALLSFRRGPS